VLGEPQNGLEIEMVRRLVRIKQVGIVNSVPDKAPRAMCQRRGIRRRQPRLGVVVVERPRQCRMRAARGGRAGPPIS